MLYLIDADNRIAYEDRLGEMHELRARVFDERLQWDVTVKDGREEDGFDRADPLYLLSVNGTTGRLEGSVRILPTTGPNMLRDVFPQLLPDGLVVESPLVWETSRFCIDPGIGHDANGRINRVTTELLCGLVEIGLKAGLTHFVSVYDARMARIFRSANCPGEVIGTPLRIGRVMTYAGLFDVSPQLWDGIAAKAGIDAPLLFPETQVARSAA